jgi:hypothetical protein
MDGPSASVIRPTPYRIERVFGDRGPGVAMSSDALSPRPCSVRVRNEVKPFETWHIFAIGQLTWSTLASAAQPSHGRKNLGSGIGIPTIERPSKRRPPSAPAEHMQEIDCALGVSINDQSLINRACIAILRAAWTAGNTISAELRIRGSSLNLEILGGRRRSITMRNTGRTELICAN